MIMKKLFTPLLMLAALLSSTQAWAQSLSVAGVRVNTSATSVQTITGSGISGTVTYNPSSRLLTLNNATITATGDGIYMSDFGDNYVYIYLIGTNKITTSSTASSCAPIYVRSNLSIYPQTNDGRSSLTIENTGAGNAMRVESNWRVNIGNTHFTAKSASADCLYGYGSNNILGPSNTWMTLTAPSGKAACTGFTGWAVYYNGISSVAFSTSGYSYNSSKKGITDSSGNLASSVKVEPSLVIGGVPLNPGSDWSYASSSTMGSAMGLTAGTLSYTYSDKTLELQGATLTYSGMAIISHVSGLTIKSSTSENTITSTGWNGIELYAPTTFAGDKKITIKGNSTGVCTGYGLNAPITINVNATARFEGGTIGIYNSYTSSAPNCDLIIKKAGSNSDYYFKGPNGSISGFCHLTMSDMDFYYSSNYGTPACYWDEAGRIVKTTGGTVVKNADVNIYGISATYPIYVCGKQLNNCNSQALGSPYLTAGTVKYNSDSKTLTLDGVTMNVTADDVSTIKTTSGAGDITIKAIGDNTLTSVATAAKLYSNTTFTSSSIAYLRFISNNSMGVSMYGSANATVDMVGFFQAKGAKYGFYGDGSTYPNAVLTLKKATSDEMGYNFTGAEGAIENLASLKLDNMDFWYSTYGCYFDEADKRVEVNGGAVAKGQVVFGSIKETLPISVCGKQLNRVNGADNPIYVGSKYISSGTQSVGYVPSTKTLTLNNAKIESVGSHGIEMKLEGNIKLVGTNSLSAKTTTNSRYSAICANKFNITITGDGSLNATSDKNCGIHAHEGIVTITDNVKIDATGDCGGLGSISSDYAGTFIISGNAQVKSNKITNVASLTLNDGQTIVEPFKAAFNSTNKRVEVNGSVAQNVVIQKVEKYDLAVCDVDVNSYNKDDILRDGGSFKYDPNMKRLTITDADIDDASVVEGIWNKGIEGLNIAINGDNQINVYEDIFRLARSTTFSGSGTVKGELASSSGYGIYLAAANVIGNLNGPKFEFTGRRGVGDNDYSNTNLIIEKGCLVFNPNSSSATILKIKNLTLGSGMIIAKPQGGTFSSSLKGITVDGTNLYYGHAVICQKGDVNVDGTVAIADAVAVLNAMAGQKVAGDPDVNGDKEVSIADFVAVLNIMAGQ